MLHQHLKFISFFFILSLIHSCVGNKKADTIVSATHSEPIATIKALSAHEIPRQLKALHPNGTELSIRLALTMDEQVQGLSGVKPNEFTANEAMLFFYPSDGERRFWMPDTYFDLDIFFLDSNLTVIDVDRDVKHHPGRDQNPPIAITRTVYCRHVLEMASTSPLAKALKPGDKLSWKGQVSLEQIELSVRPR